MCASPEATAHSVGRSCEPERLANRLVPLLGAFGTAALGPAGEHGAFHEFLMRFGVGGLDTHELNVGELAQRAGLLAGVAIVGLGHGLLECIPHLVLLGLHMLVHEVLDHWVEPVWVVDIYR